MFGKFGLPKEASREKDEAVNAVGALIAAWMTAAKDQKVSTRFIVSAAVNVCAMIIFAMTDSLEEALKVVDEDITPSLKTALTTNWEGGGARASVEAKREAEPFATAPMSYDN